LNLEVFSELDRLFSELKQEGRVRVVILTGEGEKAFAAGTDINMMKGLQLSEVSERAMLVNRAQAQIEEFPVPVIAAVNGLALGGGCEVAMACDIRIASANAKFGQPEINLGIIPGGGGTQRLARLVGISRAKELVYSGDIIDARQAFEMGLVNKVVAPAELMNEARLLAGKIAGKSLPILRLAKSAINYGYSENLDKGLEYEMKCFKACFATEDQSEGMQAFVERRKPVFKDK
jgi:enoyl-CoA hydratase